MRRSKVPLNVGGESKRVCCKAELVRVTSQISVEIAPPYLTSLASRPMTVVLGLGTRLRVRMRTKLENGVLSNGQQPQSVVNGFC